MGPVSFEIFLQAFEEGDAAERGGAAIRRFLLAHADAHEPEHQFVHVTYSDGGADVYGVPPDGAQCDGLMFSRIKGEALDLVVEVAQLADLVIMPVGCAVCVVSESQIEHLPPALRDGAVDVVRSGRELADVIARS